MKHFDVKEFHLLVHLNK